MPIANTFAKVTHSATLRASLERVSLYLTTYETLKSAIIERVKGFFSDGWTITEDGELDAQLSAEYKNRVITLQSRDELTACCLFLRDISCLSDDQIETIKRLRSHRNSVAHEIVSYITRPDRHVDPQFIADAYRLVKHIDLWWIREFELPLNPDWTPEMIDEVRWDEVTGGYSFLLEMILPLFDGDTSELDRIHEHLENNLNKEG